MKGEKLLVTGATGFTGKHLITAAIEDGYECIAIAQDDRPFRNSSIRALSLDISNASALSELIDDVQPDYVIHLAAVSFVAHGDTRSIYETNVVGTINLLEALAEKASKVKNVLLASSGNIYGNSNDLPITEDTAPAPMNDYGVSKLSMEMAANIRSNQLPIVVSRPFNYTGAGQSKRFLVPKIVDAYRCKKKKLELGNLDVSRDFSDVRDVVRAYLSLIRSDSAGKTVNICSGHPVSLNEIVDRMNEIAGYEMEIRVNPEFVRSNEIKILYGSNKRLVDNIGDYRKYTIDDTLMWMFNSEA